MANPQLEAILDKLRVLTPEDSELLKETFCIDPWAYSITVALEKDCLREGYFKEYRQLVALTGHIPSLFEIEKLELELLVAGELKRYDDCCKETEFSPLTEQIKIKERELLSAGKWKEYRRIENHTQVSLSPKELKPFEVSLREKQRELLVERQIDEYFSKVNETGIKLSEAQIREALKDYLQMGNWNHYLELSEEADVKLSSKQLSELKSNRKVTEQQMREFEEGFDKGHFTDFLMSKECLGFMPEPSKIQAAQCSHLCLKVSEGVCQSYQRSLNDKEYKASVDATGISVSLEQLELVRRLKDYRLC